MTAHTSEYSSKLEDQQIQNDAKKNRSVMLSGEEIEQIVATTKELEAGEMSAENSERFIRISSFLSRLLPNLSDKSLLDIDDILYSNNDLEPGDVTYILPEESMTSIMETCFKSFQLYYYAMVSNKVEQNHGIVDQAMLQLIENFSDSEFEFQNICLGDILSLLLKSRTGRHVCQAIKFLKVILSKESHKHVIKKGVYLIEELFWLSNLGNITGNLNPRERRMSTWLSNQRVSIFGKLDFFEIMRKKEKASVSVLEKLKQSNYDQSYLKLVNCLSSNRPIKVGHLYHYFSSAKTDEERSQRAKDFLKANAENETEVENIEKGVVRFVRKYLTNFHSFHHQNMAHRVPDHVLRLVDRCHCNDVEPYISTDDNVFTNQQTSDKTTDLTTAKDQYDFAVEKWLFYDEFLKYLYVMSKMYDACLRSKELLNTEEDFEDFDAAFRDTDIKYFIRARLVGQSKCDGLPWWFHTVLRKCPFLILSKCREYMISDIEKMLKGEEISDITRENLYYVLSSFPKFEGSN